MKTMTTSEKIKMVEKVCNVYNELDKLCDSVGDMFGHTPDSKFFDSVWGLVEVLIKHTSRAIGDEYEWLNWYVFDNDCGQKGNEAGYDGKMKPVKTAKDLVKLINEGENSERSCK